MLEALACHAEVVVGVFWVASVVLLIVGGVALCEL